MMHSNSLMRNSQCCTSPIITRWYISIDRHHVGRFGEMTVGEHSQSFLLLRMSVTQFPSDAIIFLVMGPQTHRASEEVAWK
ncbi:hypothetical protein MPTK1_2g07680 [Marchantia polymorpha subsp. ruderalis]|uniref:Uncharacterized protein n=1 Tax=Marchantia polymorpha TaxID=3197 RepID=A0A2R6XGL1_MARPO|nr:hypothetical protein MARPO_0015s0054 [Marchantia polymorpha]BBN01479.1 hypothetical protein Mp_2g07680 [Marchantia polymorpha subsp. ruderalis]|eukprot:PTQ45246.1 hypothetical protein MARPO_0015s0054 [Marchantia polymorpha]